MKPHQPSGYRDAIGLAILKKVLGITTLLVSVLLFVSLFSLGEKYKIPALSLLGIMVLAAGFALAYFSVPAVIERMREDKAMLLSGAIVHTFYSHIAMAAFLPVVGPLFARMIDKRNKNPFTQNDE